MGVSVGGAGGVSSMMAEITLQNQEAEGAEEQEIALEMLDPEMLAELAKNMGQGCLKGESRAYTFTLDLTTALPQKVYDSLTDSGSSSALRLRDSKMKEHVFSPKEHSFKEKSFKVESARSHLLEKKEGDNSDSKTFQKVDGSAHKTLEKAALPKSLLSHKESGSMKQQQSQAKTLEHRVLSGFVQQEKSRPKESSDRENQESRKPDRGNERQQLNLNANRPEKNEQRERDEQNRRQKKDEEEGFAESNRENHPDPEQQNQCKENTIHTIEASFVKEFDDYALQESILSELFKMRVSQFDVLILFIEVMKLEIKGKEQERIARQTERELQLMHMRNIVDGYKTQGKWAMMSSLGSGVLAIVSGVCPIVNHVGGGWILGKLSGIFSSLQGMDKNQFFKGVSKITFAMSEMYKSTGQIQQTFSEGHRAFDQHMSDIYRTDHEEHTRTMEEIKDAWKGIENFLYQTLQMYHDAIRQLYNN